LSDGRTLELETVRYADKGDAMAERIVRGYGIHDRLKDAGGKDGDRPAWLIAVDGDGEEVKITVTEARNKWARVMLALRELAWVRCDVFNKKGGLVFRHQRNADDRDAPAGDLEELPPTRAMAEMAGMMNIMLRGQEMVLSRHQQTVAGKDDALMKLVELTLKRFETQEERLEQSMQLNHQLSADLVQAQLAQLQLVAPPSTDSDGNERPHSDRAIDAMVPSILRHVFTQGNNNSKPPQQPGKTPKNGHAKNGASQKSTADQRPESSTQTPHE
jgi:hypothetical protein